MKITTLSKKIIILALLLALTYSLRIQNSNDKGNIL